MFKSFAVRMVVLIATAGFIEVATAASPRTDFESDEVLGSAMTEINALNRDQLEAVIDYIASCNPTPAPERDFRCERATEIVSIKTAQSKTFARIILSLRIIDKLIPWKGSGIGPQVAKDIQRRIDVFSELRRAASERYAGLNAPSERK